MTTETNIPASFGVANVVRVTGDVNLFGSNVSNHECIELNFYGADIQNRSGQPVISPNEKAHHISVRMTELQWARLLSSVSSYSGVPVTITKLEGKHVKQEEVTPFSRDVYNETRKAVLPIIEEMQQEMETMKALIQGDGNLNTKAGRKALEDRLSALHRKVSDSIPWVANVIDERVNKSVEEARASVDVYARNAHDRLQYEADRLGLASDAAINMPRLTEEKQG